MKDKTTNKCKKVTGCIYAFFNSSYWPGPYIFCSIKSDKDMEEQRKKEEEKLQEEQEKLLPWGSA